MISVCHTLANKVSQSISPLECHFTVCLLCVFVFVRLFCVVVCVGVFVVCVLFALRLLMCVVSVFGGCLCFCFVYVCGFSCYLFCVQL